MLFRSWALPDARLHSILERLAIAKYWRDHFKALDQAVREDPALLAVSDMAEYKQIERYASEVGEIMVLIADTLLPRNEDADFEPFLQRSLDS